MSTTTGRDPGGRPLRKPAKEDRQAAYWVGQLVNAENGADALNKMWSWVLGRLAALDGQRPQSAEAARHHLARQLAAYAAALPKAKIEYRVGLTEAEEAALFDPWGKQQEATQ